MQNLKQALDIRLATAKTDREACYRLRHTVFVEEQGVPVALEIDEHDETDAHHFIGTLDNEPVAASRVLVAGNRAKIGRLVVLNKCRGKGFGVDMMLAMIAYAKSLQGISQLALDAQTQATGFYQALGFAPQGMEFMDAGILHQRMVMDI